MRGKELTAIDKFLNKMISNVRARGRECDLWSEAMSNCQRAIKTNQREDFRCGDGNSVWLTQFASNLPSTTPND